MDSNYKALFYLTKSVLHKKCNTCSIDNFKDVLKLAKKHAIDGMFYDLPSINGIGEDRKNYLQWIGGASLLENMNRWMNSKVAKLAKVFDDNNIRYAIMKGQTCGYYYPNPLHRKPGDIDVYVVDNDFEKANNLLIDYGFELIDKTMLHSTYKKEQLEIEVHFAIQKLQWLPAYNRLKELTKKEFDTIDREKDKFLNINNYKVRILPNELNIILLTAHAFNHIINGGLGLRQIIDWQVVLIANHTELNIEKLIYELKSLHLYKTFQVLGYFNVKYLGMNDMLFKKYKIDIESKYIARLGEKLLSWTIVCGNFGHSMDLGTGLIRNIRYYGLFFKNLYKFFWLNPFEMIAWPGMKLYRGITGKNHLKNI